MKKSVLIVVYTLGFPIAAFSALILLSAPRIVNDISRRRMCENSLKTVWAAIELYRADENGRFPPSLEKIKPYLTGRYCNGPDGLPVCPGSRGEDETGVLSPYEYHVPSGDGGIQPVCWDSKAHILEGSVLPDLFRYNVLYSDGHIDALNEQEFVRQMARFFADKPAILGQIELSARPRDGRTGAFILGVVTGIVGLYVLLRSMRWLCGDKGGNNGDRHPV